MTSVSRIAKVSLSLVAVLLIVGCGGGGGDNGDGLARLQGTAILPPGVDQIKVVADNAPVQVLDLSQPAPNRVIANSTTDANGRYDVTVPEARLVAVVVQGTAQVSGLVQANSNPKTEIAKDFTGATDLACRGGVGLINDGTLEPDDFDGERIANLENAANAVVASGQVNFKDERSVTNAVNVILVSTGNGDHPAFSGNN